MIRIRIGAVVRVTDGFTGMAPAKNTLAWMLDGQPCRPMEKLGGYYLFTDIMPGRHLLRVSGPHFRAEEREFEPGTEEIGIVLHPGEGYPFGREVARLTLRLNGPQAAGGVVWSAAQRITAELRIAQTGLKEGDDRVRLFFRASARQTALPQEYLLLDGEKTEVCRVEVLEEEGSRLARPLRFGHRRGCSLYPAFRYTADETGLIRAVYREPMETALFRFDTGELKLISLHYGENTAEL